MMVTNDIFEKVKTEIIHSNMSLGQIARQSGLSKSTIKHWLSGRNAMTVDNAQSVLAVLGKELRVEDRSNNAKVSQ